MSSVDRPNTTDAWSDPLNTDSTANVSDADIVTSGLAGLLLAFISGGACFAGWRVIDSETEGFHALFFVLCPAGGAFLALIISRFVRKAGLGTFVQFIPTALMMALVVMGCMWLRQNLYE